MQQIITYIIQNMLKYLTVLLWCIFLHELGHWLYFKLIMKKNIEIRFTNDFTQKWHIAIGYPADYIRLSKKRKTGIYLSGLILGLIPIVYSWFYFQRFDTAVLFICYGTGCTSDIFNLIKNVFK